MNPRDRRTAVVGIVVIVTLVSLTRGLPALIAWRRREAANAVDTATRLALARASLRALPVARDSLRVLTHRLSALDSTLLGGSSVSAAAAELAAVIDDDAVASRLRISTTQLRTDAGTNGLIATVAIRITAVTDVVGLAAFLSAVEGGGPLLLVRELTVTQSEPAAADNRAEALRVEILVEGVTRVAPVKGP